MDRQEFVIPKIDRDVSDLTGTVKSHTGMLEALREEQIKQSAILGEHSTRLDRLERSTAEGFATIGAQLQLLIDRDAGEHDH